MEAINFDLISYLLSFSDEVLLNTVFPTLSLDILENLCSSNIRFNNICQNERLWIHKVTNDYPDFINQKPNTFTWKDFYIYLYHNVKRVPIIYNNSIAYYIWINKFDNFDTIKSKITVTQPPKFVLLKGINDRTLYPQPIWPMISYILILDTDIVITRLTPLRGGAYSIFQLKEILKSLGISPIGNKQILVNRVKDVLIS